ncbi:hypothetical protein IMCC21224_111907 [Puniceibacterium sp. IMCC21224]|nr:hypothetical protein IMCC21224_111907 [Puniceibacterium sp. IMCC21224]
MPQALVLQQGSIDGRTRADNLIAARLRQVFSQNMLAGSEGHVCCSGCRAQRSRSFFDHRVWPWQMLQGQFDQRMPLLTGAEFDWGA